MNHIQVKGIIY